MLEVPRAIMATKWPMLKDAPATASADRDHHAVAISLGWIVSTTINRKDDLVWCASVVRLLTLCFSSVGIGGFGLHGNASLVIILDTVKI